MGKVGVTMDMHMDLQPGTELVKLARRIESAGYESLWLSDAMSREPYATATFLLANTTKLKVGTAIATVYGRDAMTSAQARRTIAEFSGGRFFLGLGVSNKQIIDLRHGEWIKPSLKLGRYLDQLHADLSVSAAPAKPAPVYVAAHGPELQKLGRDKADGILTWTMPPGHIARSRKFLGPKSEISAQVPCVFNTDPAAARATARKYLAPIWLPLPHYRKAWMESGLSEKDFEGEGSDALIDAIFAWGDNAKIAKKIKEYHDAGANRVIAEPLRNAPPGSVHPLTGPVYVTADWDGLIALAPALSL